MAYVKTAVSLPESLFEQVEALARELKIPRSRVLALGVKELVRHRDNKKMLAAINKAYQTPETAEDRAVRKSLIRGYSKLVEGQW